MNWPLEGRTNSSKRHSSNCMNCKKVVSNSGCKHDFNTSHYVVVVNAFTLLTSLIHQNCFYTLSVRTSSSTGLIVSQRIASLMLLAFWDSLFHQKPKKKNQISRSASLRRYPPSSTFTLPQHGRRYATEDVLILTALRHPPFKDID